MSKVNESELNALLSALRGCYALLGRDLARGNDDVGDLADHLREAVKFVPDGSGIPCPQ